MTDSTLGVTRREALKRGVVVGGAAVVWATPTAHAFGMTSNLAADTSGLNRGCTPGFWKQEQHFAAWPTSLGYRPDNLLKDHFPSSGWCDYEDLNNFKAEYDKQTLLDALEFRGSYNGTSASGLDGAVRILMRAAVAFMLNVASFYSGPSNVQAEVVDKVLDVLTKDCGLSEESKRAEIIGLAKRFDGYNNRDCNWDGGAGEFILS